MSDTIFALSTPPGRSAIAVIRLSGTEVRATLAALCGAVPEPRRASLRRIIDPASGRLLDEALVLYFAAPRSETGEDMAELQVHGGRAVIAATLAALEARPGCRPAEPGEFARRGLINGKLDLLQIEGLADLIDAETEAQRRQAMSAASGASSATFGLWRSGILAALALVEAAIDFSDEADIADSTVHRAETGAGALASSLASALDDGNRGEILREGFRVALTGPPNVGKSSLLNALARREAAIVSEEAGTTRDVIEVRLDLEGVPVVISDTAGLRETASKVEQEGIRRSLATARTADLVLWLTEAADAPAAARPPPPAPPPDIADTNVPVITVETKADLLTPDTPVIHVKHESAGQDGTPPGAALATGLRSRVRVSARTGDGIDDLTAELAARARNATGSPGDALITRSRQRREIAMALARLEQFLAEPQAPLELRAEQLRRAAGAVGRLTGHIGSDDVLGEIFGRFCIGK